MDSLCTCFLICFVCFLFVSLSLHRLSSSVFLLGFCTRTHTVSFRILPPPCFFSLALRSLTSRTLRCTYLSSPFTLRRLQSAPSLLVDTLILQFLASFSLPRSRLVLSSLPLSLSLSPFSLLLNDLDCSRLICFVSRFSSVEQSFTNEPFCSLILISSKQEKKVVSGRRRSSRLPHATSVSKS